VSYWARVGILLEQYMDYHHMEDVAEMSISSPLVGSELSY